MRRSIKCFEKAQLKVDPYVKDLDEIYFDFESIIIPQSHILFEWKKLSHEMSARNGNSQEHDQDGLSRN